MKKSVWILVLTMIVVGGVLGQGLDLGIGYHSIPKIIKVVKCL
jgi:cytochrome bd-type quinol oxidase subunit 2